MERWLRRSGAVRLAPRAVANVLVLAAMLGCESSEKPPCPGGFTHMPWGSSGESLCDRCPDGSPAPTCVPQAGECDGEGGSGETATYVVALLRPLAADPDGDPAVVGGFDLDGRVSDDTDVYGCFHDDYVSPPPDAQEGVDNQLGPILSSWMEFDAAEQISSGNLLILVTVDGIDSFAEDPCVHVTLERATLEASAGPELDATGRLASGQTFAVHDSPSWIAGAPAAISGGRLELGPLPDAVPLDLGVATFPMLQVRLRLELSATGFDAGTLGGAVDTDDAADALVAADPDFPVGLARSIMEGSADLHPDDTVACHAISAGWEVEGVQAVRE